MNRNERHPRRRMEVLQAIEHAWEHHPDASLLELVCGVIGRPWDRSARVSDEELLEGLQRASRGQLNAALVSHTEDA